MARLSVLILEVLSSPCKSGKRSLRPLKRRRISHLLFLSVELCAHLLDMDLDSSVMDCDEKFADEVFGS